MKVNYYDRLYYSVYLLLNCFGKFDLFDKSKVFFSLLIILNILSVSLKIIDNKLFSTLNNFWGIILMTLPVILFNDIYFRKRKILLRFSDIKNKKKKIYKIVGITYIFTTIIFLILVY